MHGFCSQVFWMKDNVEIDVDSEINFIISHDGNLLINQARLSDSGNYTCGAQNLASRRLSEAATLNVYERHLLWKYVHYKKLLYTNRETLLRHMSAAGTRPPLG